MGIEQPESLVGMLNGAWSRTRLKLLCFDGSGLWVCAKRLERGRFRWPEPAAGERRLQLGAHELALLLGGMDLAAVRPRRWHRRAPSAA